VDIVSCNFWLAYESQSQTKKVFTGGDPDLDIDQKHKFFEPSTIDSLILPDKNEIRIL